MKLRDWLDVTELNGLTIIIYDDVNPHSPLWAGSADDAPYWITKYKLASREDIEDYTPIDYRADLGDEYNNKAGFVIVIK